MAVSVEAKRRFVHLRQILIVCAFLMSVIPLNHPVSNITNSSLTTSSTTPLRFEPNLGQFDPSIQFIVRASGYILYLTANGAVIQTSSTPSMRTNRGHDIAVGNEYNPNNPQQSTNQSPLMELIHLDWQGASHHADIVGGMIVGYSNYFIGNNPAQWRKGVPNYASITYHDLYPGIDLTYYSNSEGKLEYDLIVAPDVDPNLIKMAVSGATSIEAEVKPNKLALRTLRGSLTFEEVRIYQNSSAGMRSVTGEFVLHDKTVSFSLNEYDHRQPLIIDPQLEYSTYLGGSGNDINWDAVVDSTGSVYITGYTLSTDFPVVRANQSELLGNYDVFVSKLSYPGSGNVQLVYSTYYGGGDEDYGYGISVDSFDDIYVAGRTFSSDLPLVNQYQAHQGSYDAFVVKLHDSGSGQIELVYSTYFGGTDYDWANGMTVDAAGCAYITGETFSVDFPRLNAFQNSYQGGSSDGFIAKFAPSGNSLVYSTYLGGFDSDRGERIAVDRFGNAIVGGSTLSNNFPSLQAVQAANHGGEDNFITKMSYTGGTLQLSYSTYFGGIGSEDVSGLALNFNGDVYITGQTSSTDYPLHDALQTIYHGNGDIFVTALRQSSENPLQVVYSTYLGGDEYDWGTSIAVDSSDTAYMTGLTASRNLPTVNGFQPYYQGGTFDAFVFGLRHHEGTSVQLVYATYLGGGYPEGGYSIGVDPHDAVYVAGATSSRDFPVAAAYQDHVNGSGDIFVTKLNPHETANPATPTPTSVPPPPTHTLCAIPFTDIDTSVFREAIAQLYCRGVVSGTGLSTYSPSATSTRGQFARVVVKGFGLPFYTPTSPSFTDVAPNYFAYTYIETGVHQGILSGYDPASCAVAGATAPCYLPNRSINRAELTRLVVKAAAYPLITPPAGPTFQDVPTSNFAYVYIETAHQRGIVHGVDINHFAPSRSIRRDEMAGIVYTAISTPLHISTTNLSS